MSQPTPYIAVDLLTEQDGQPMLIGGCDRQSGRVVFPLPADADRFETIVLPRSGTLWSWTIQRFRPKSPPYAGPEAFTPYAVGYVALDDVIIVEGRLADISFDRLRIGLMMEVVTESFVLATGEARLTYAFRPVEGLAA